MATFTRQLTRNAAALIAVIGLLAFTGAPTAQATVIGNTNNTGVGGTLDLSAANTYTHKLDFPGDGNTTAINGVTFDTAGTSGPNHQLIMANPSNFDNGNAAVMADFIHNGGRVAGETATLALGGLTPGETYDVRLYYRDFGSRPNAASFNAGGGAESLGIIDQTSGVGNENYHSIVYVADGHAVQLDLTQQVNNASWHHYAVTNQVVDVPEPKILNIQDLFNTGVGSNGLALGDGVDDPHWNLVVDPSGLGDAVVPNGFPIGPWLANDTDSRWIGPDATSANGPPGDYVYETTFTLDNAAALSSVLITGDWGSDNGGLDILLNGNSVGAGQLSGGFGSLTAFSIDGSNGFFQHGLNTLQFAVNNAGTGVNPAGFRVDNIVGTFTLVPEPTTAALALLGTIGLVSRRRRNNIAA